MSQLRLRSSSFHEHGSSSGGLGFHECGSSSGALFFHDSGSTSGFYSFLHINILIVLVCLKLNGKLMKSSRTKQNLENIPNILSNLIWQFFTSSTVTMRKSAKKRHRNNFSKNSRWFCFQCLRTFCYLRQKQENGCLENYIRVRAFKHRPVPLTKCFAVVVCFACCSIDDSN